MRLICEKAEQIRSCVVCPALGKDRDRERSMSNITINLNNNRFKIRDDAAPADSDQVVNPKEAEPLEVEPEAVDPKGLENSTLRVNSKTQAVSLIHSCQAWSVLRMIRRIPQLKFLNPKQQYNHLAAAQQWQTRAMKCSPLILQRIPMTPTTNRRQAY